VSAPVRDCWAEWLAHRRFGGDADVKEKFLEELRRTRDRVLDKARLALDETLLDVGCGDGLIGFGALERGAREVVFSDVSDDLLEACRSRAAKLGVLDRCRFVRASADDLAQIEDASVDVVTTRSVLIYVERKREAFAEFFRVLRDGGRVSLFEPINRLNRFLRAFDTAEVQELEDRIRAVYDELQPQDSDPMLNFDDRDLVDLAEAAGFGEVHLELRVEVKPPDPIPWEAYSNMAFNPKIPTIAEAMEQVLTADERALYEAHMRPLVEQGRGSRRMAAAYLWALKTPSA
jgi:ubiquinone/menaquinone biosynthesis C-methylase UbiE